MYHLLKKDDMLIRVKLGNWVLCSSLFLSWSNCHGEETAQSGPLAPLMKSCTGFSDHVRRRSISVEISETNIE